MLGSESDRCSAQAAPNLRKLCVNLRKYGGFDVSDVHPLPKRPIPKVWGPQEWRTARALTQCLFEPMSPIDQNDLFSGRLEQVGKLLDVVYDKGSHAIIYGE